MISVPAAEFQKQFGRFREAAQHEPVQVTSYGRESVVLISAADFAEYVRLKEGQRTALHASQLTDEELRAMDESEIPEETASYDVELYL
jgi:prevent-host-death family protein